MSINRSLSIFACLLFLSTRIVAQDSTKVQDPLPVVITQEGYVEQSNAQDLPLSEQSFKQRLKYGGSAGPFQFSSYGSVIGLSPMVGYKLTEKTIFGGGASIIFWRDKDPVMKTKVKRDLIGFSAFIRQDLPFTEKLGFPLHATVEAVQFQGLQIKEKFKPSLLVGLGLGNAGGYGLQVLYDLNYEFGRSFSGSFNDSPLVIRATGFFN
jgi:hypothetical protein